MYLADPNNQENFNITEFSKKYLAYIGILGACDNLLAIILSARKEVLSFKKLIFAVWINEVSNKIVQIL